MLIIVESPAKAKTISKIVGNKHIVKASVGHIRSLSDSKKTSDGRTLEISGIDIEKDFHPVYEVDEGKAAVVKELQKLAKAAKDGILFATDSDREGEAISWHLSEVLGIKDKSKIQRLEFHEITKKAIDEAMANPRDLNLQLVSAQQARQVLDKLVGYKLSPVIWNVMGNRHLSAGRVQSPALHLVCQREKEILNFIPVEYWEIKGAFDAGIKAQPVQTIWRMASDKNDESEKDTNEPEEENSSQLVLKLSLSKGKKLPKEITNKETVELLTQGLSEQAVFTVVEINEKTEYSYTKPPFITSTLQQAASSKLGFAPKLTMQLAQKLYEGIDIDGSPTALITYMRTDSVNLSTESVHAARAFIKKSFPEYLPAKAKTYKTKSRNAQEAHEAIRPTNPLLTPRSLQGKLDSKMLRLYELIWNQMIACQMTDEIRQRLTFDLQNEVKDQFSGSVAWTTHRGFKALTGEDLITENIWNIQKDQKFTLTQLINIQNFTKPPSRFTAASLIKKLEELGIGRPSTYASIIATLQDREYVETNKNQMLPTALGMKVNDLLTDNFQQITSSELTAEMEENLDEISRGEKAYNQVLGDFWWNFKQEVESKSKNLAEQRDKYKSTSTDVKCPVCQSEMDLKIGRFGEYYQCQVHKEHAFPKNFREYEEALKVARELYENQAKGKHCSECGKELIVRVSKSSLKPYIACSDYQVGNQHTVKPISLGPCPKCQEEGRTGDKQGELVAKKGFRGKGYIGCSLPKEVCGYIQKD
jgi:DNA topoisomerase-1